MAIRINGNGTIQQTNGDEAVFQSGDADTNEVLIWDGTDWVPGDALTAADLEDGVRYQEGTFTPVFFSGDGGITGITNIVDARWTRVGNTVYFVGRFTLVNSGNTASTDRVVVSGLPYDAADASSLSSTPGFQSASRSVWAQWYSSITNNSDTVSFTCFATNGTVTQAVPLTFAGSYITDDTTFVPAAGATVTEDIQGNIVGGGGISDAPSDGTQYARQDGSWTEVSASGSGADAWGYIASGGGIAGSLNIQSVTKTDTGKYSIVFTTPMPNSDYAVTTSITASNSVVQIRSQTATGFDVWTSTADSALLADRGFGFAVFATNALPPRGTTGADAWVNGKNDGTGAYASYNATVARRSGSPTGAYTVTFTNPMPSANYAVVVSQTNSNYTIGTTNQSATGFDVLIRDDSLALQDRDFHAVVHATNAQLPNTVTQEQIDQAVSGRYQQGTWTPKMGASGGDSTHTYSTNLGIWTRIGNRVTIEFECVIDVHGANGTGIAGVTGLPYLPENSNSYSGVINYSANFDAGYNPTTLRYSQSNPYQAFTFYKYSETSGHSNIGVGRYNVGTVVSGSASFITDDTTWTPINGATVD